jgi:hypothetical protein
MLTIGLLSVWLRAASGAGSQPAASRLIVTPEQSARCADVFETADERVKPSLKISPGLPPLLNFRHFEGRMHQRFSGIDLTLDDAGH